MFVGHFAAAMAAKRAKPEMPLGPLVLAAMLADMLWLVFLAAGIERLQIQPGRGINAMASADIPWSHSLLMVAVWGAALAVVIRRSLLIFAAAVSHWVLDWISHLPRDLVLAPGLHRHFGLGLWASIPATLLVEGGMWVLAIVVYLRMTKPRTRAGTWGFWLAVVLLTLLWLANLNSGPTAPDPRAEAVSFVVFGSFIAWAYWIDRAR